MSDRRKDSSSDQDKAQQHHDFIEKFNIRQQMKDAFLKLMENRPENPMLFLSNYFDSISVGEKTDRISNAASTLHLSHHSCPAFQSNLVVAYEILSAPKNPNSKKFANKRSGLSGSVHEELIKYIGKEISQELLEPLLAKVCCRWNEMVPFEIFRYSITVTYVLQDFISLSKDLYLVLSGRKENAADRYICQATIDAFKESLTHGSANKVSKALEAGNKLRPDNLAYVLLQAKEDEGDTKAVMEMESFVFDMAKVYLENVKCLQ